MKMKCKICNKSEISGFKYNLCNPCYKSQWTKNKKELINYKQDKYKCGVCGGDYIKTNTNQKYCSKKCNTKVQLKKHIEWYYKNHKENLQKQREVSKKRYNIQNKSQRNFHSFKLKYNIYLGLKWLNYEMDILDNKKFYRWTNRNGLNETSKKWYELNKEKRLKKSREWWAKNKESMKDYKFKRKKHYNKMRQEWKKKKMLTDIDFKIKCKASNNIRSALNWRDIDKKDKTMNILGCSINYYKEYMKKQFKKGMSWDNYGVVWHIDHRIPLSWFDLTDEKQLYRAFHFSNTKPMFKNKNLLKGHNFAEPSLQQIIKGDFKC